MQNEIRNDYRWLDTLILRCLDVEPARRFKDAVELLQAIEACEKGEALAPVHQASDAAPASLQPQQTRDADQEQKLRRVRRLLASKSFAEVIDRLDVHRPPEWAALDAFGARILRTLGQAYLGLGDVAAARDCLEQLRSGQKEQALLLHTDFAAALSDLCKCYKSLGQLEAAKACQEEARRLL